MSYTLDLKKPTLIYWEHLHAICCFVWKEKIKQLIVEEEIDEAKASFMKALERIENEDMKTLDSVEFEEELHSFYTFPDYAPVVAKLYNLQEDDVLNAKDVRW